MEEVSDVACTPYKVLGSEANQAFPTSGFGDLESDLAVKDDSQICLIGWTLLVIV